jgi:hypothetical protein
MLTARKLPQIPVKPKTVVLSGGLDTESSPLEAKPGTARAVYNYEAAFDGGFERLRGIERFDGRPRPSDALYQALTPATTFTGVAVGNTVTGATSGATGQVVYVSAEYIAITRVVGTFVAEALTVAGSPIGACTAAVPNISSEQDNILSAAAADAYRADITAVPGSGPVRGIASLGSDVFAWRDNAGGTAMALHKATAAGWVEVPLFYELSFSAGGGTPPAEGATVTKGAVSAVVKRVVLESGAWGSTTAAGRLIIAAPAGGSFTAGAFTAGMTGNVTAAYLGTAITLAPGGKVETDTWNFTGSQDTRRLYGCDGINREFEFDGTVLVPLNTGMGSIRAKFVRAHKNFLFFLFKGSLQKSAVGSPYQWSAVLGASEIGLGDEGTGLVPAAGGEGTTAMVVTTRDMTFVLYGDTGDTFRLVPISRNAGAHAYSLQDMSVPIGHDEQGFRKFIPTQEFGNFQWDLASREIDSLARSRTPVCSVFTAALSRYRCFFSDGTVVTATPVGQNIRWARIDYGFVPNVAYAGEVASRTRVFYGGADGIVYEADVGRSLDGEPIQAACRLMDLNMGSPLLSKQFRTADVEVSSQGHVTLYVSGEFNDGDPEIEQVSQQAYQMIGQGGQFDVSQWDVSRFDAAPQQRIRVSMRGLGYSVAPFFYSLSSVELSHKLKSATFLYSPRKLITG